MANRGYRLSDQAVRDLEGIATYLGERSVDAADAVIDELTRTFKTLLGNPEVGTKLDEVRSDLRVFVPSHPAASYLVFFYGSDDGVLISDVVHAARDWIGMLKRGER